MIKGLKEMRITHEGMLDIFHELLRRKLMHPADARRPARITQSSQTKEFIITFEGEQVKSILPPVEE